MADLVVVTLAARYWSDIPDLVEEGDHTIESGMLVPVGDELSGVVRMAPRLAIKAAPGPDEWRAVVQIAIALGGTVATNVAVGLIVKWIMSRVRAEPQPPSVIDQSLHIQNDVRVFIGHIEVHSTDPDEIEQAVRGQVRAQTPNVEVPPQLSQQTQGLVQDEDEDDDAFGQRWVEYWTERGRAHQEDMARRIERANRESEGD
jgi:hypothetical protein